MIIRYLQQKDDLLEIRVTNHPLKVRKWDLKSHFLKEYIDFSVLLCYNKSVVSAINRNLEVMECLLRN